MKQEAKIKKSAPRHLASKVVTCLTFTLNEWFLLHCPEIQRWHKHREKDDDIVSNLTRRTNKVTQIGPRQKREVSYNESYIFVTMA